MMAKAKWEVVSAVAGGAPEHRLDLGKIRAVCWYWKGNGGWTWIVETVQAFRTLVSREDHCATLADAKAGAEAAARKIAREILAALDGEEDR